MNDSLRDKLRDHLERLEQTIFSFRQEAEDILDSEVPEITTALDEDNDLEALRIRIDNLYNNEFPGSISNFRSDNNLIE